MPMDAEPVVGAVYEDPDGRSFEVAGVDENEATVKLRYPDGSAEEIDLDAWYEMDLEQIAAPAGAGDEDNEDDEVADKEPPDDEGEEEDEDDLDDEYEV